MKHLSAFFRSINNDLFGEKVQRGVEKVEKVFSVSYSGTKLLYGPENHAGINI